MTMALPESVSRAWLARVRGQLGAYPTTVAGPPPAGDPVAVGHCQQDTRGTPYAAVNGFVEHMGHLEPLEMEMADGVVVPLSDVRIYYE